MDCQRIRDRFSSLWEKEMTSDEEKEIRGHLSSCPACRREFEQFEKMMQWLHTVEEVKVPEGFLGELHKKIEERRTKSIPPGRSTGNWFKLPASVKLPVQAVAMVAIVFLVLYVSKMMPTGVSHLKESEQTSSLPTSQEKPDRMLTDKKGDEEKKIVDKPAETQRLKDVDQVKTPGPAEERLDEPHVRMKAEVKKEGSAFPETGFPPQQTPDLKRPSTEPESGGKVSLGKEKRALAPRPPLEIVLRVSDREKAVSQVHQFVDQFGGEVVATEENKLVASIPTSSFSDFQKGVAGLASSAKTERVIREKSAEKTSRAAPEAKRREAPGHAVDAEDRTTVRILLIQE